MAEHRWPFPSSISQPIISALSFFVFSFFHLLDRLLCPVFSALDSLFDHPHSIIPCYCPSRNPDGTLPLPRSNSPSPSVHATCPSSVRWSDCRCSACTSWQSDQTKFLYVHVSQKGCRDATHCSDVVAKENVIFLHGFLSSSSLWSEKLIPYLHESNESSCHHFYAVDLLGFGRSPKPRHCNYTMADHINAIQESVLQRYNIDKFHLVAHSMGCIIALGLAAAHSDSVKTITLVAPPYFPVPTTESAASYTLRKVAPRRIWPPILFGASLMSWYEHVGRGVCFLVCKQHRVWEPVIKTFSLNRIPSAAVRDFMQHTHHSAWHIFHNIICAEAQNLDSYLNLLETQNDCEIHVFHGAEDNVVPAYCSHELQSRHCKLRVTVISEANHFTIVCGRERTLVKALRKIWSAYSSTNS